MISIKTILLNHKQYNRLDQFKKFAPAFALLITIFLSNSTEASAQYFQRIYANSAPSADISATVVLANVSNRADALAPSGDVEDASTLSVTLGAFGLVDASQNIRFTGDDLPAAGTPVTLKIETGGSLVDLAGAIEIQATQNGVAAGTVISDSKLLGLVGGGVLSSGKNVYEVTFIPKNSSLENVVYNGVKLKLTTALGVAVSAKFYHAYFLKSVSEPVACDAPVDVLYGVDGSIVNLIAGVSNPYTLIKSSGTTTQLNTGVSVEGNIAETVVFSGAGAGDVEVVVSIPPTVLALTVLNNISITAMNGQTAVGSENLETLIGLDLLGLFQSGEQVTLRFPATGAFDRVSIATTGLVGALASLKIHSVKRILPAPLVATSDYTIYVGESASLVATSLNATDVLTWYDASNTLVGTGSPLSVSPVVTTAYTVEARLSGSCSQKSARAIANVIVEKAPLPVTLTAFKVSKEGQTALITWNTTAETNSDYFEIQRSISGKTWDVIGTVTANGESKDLKSYFFTDKTPVSGSNLYRLKMVDRDQTFAFSAIKNVEFERSLLVLFPNPTVNKFTFNPEDMSTFSRIRVSSASGKILYDQSKQNQSELSASVNMEQYPDGIYIVNIFRTDGTVTAHKIIKR